MGSLTSKTSSQAFFLRVLKVILQLRDAARLAASKNKRKLVESQGPSAPVASSTLNATTGTEPTVAVTPDTAQQVAVLNRSTADSSEVPAPMEVHCKHVIFPVLISYHFL